MLLAALLAAIARGTWDVALRVLHLRSVEHPGIVLVPIGERTELGVAVTGLLIGLSPGSLLVDVDAERQMMLFHVIDAHDPDAVRAQIDGFYHRWQRRVFRRTDLVFFAGIAWLAVLLAVTIVVVGRPAPPPSGWSPWTRPCWS